MRCRICGRKGGGKLPDRFWAPKPGKRPFSRLLYFDRNAPPFRPFDCRLRRPESRHCSRRSQAQADYFGVYVRIPPGPPVRYKTGNARLRGLPSLCAANVLNRMLRSHNAGGVLGGFDMREGR